VTTSGAGTGTAPTVAKLHAVKQAAGDKPVAVTNSISRQAPSHNDALVKLRTESAICYNTVSFCTGVYFIWTNTAKFILILKRF